MATFYNQATLFFDGTSTTSNVTEGQILLGADVNKLAVSSDYIKGDGITYVITLTNSSGSAQNNLILTDNLGTFTPPNMNETVTPLDYVDNSILYYVNGEAQNAPDVTAAENGIVISNINIPANSNAIIIYEARANEYAPLSSGASITNRITINCDFTSENSDATATVPVRDWTSLTIAKAISPAVIGDNGEITYTFIIQNTGNTPAVATDNVIVTDTFTPILSSLEVFLNDEALEEGTGYSYDETTGEFETLEGAINVPAATFTRNSETGVVSTTPGVAILTVTGRI